MFKGSFIPPRLTTLQRDAITSPKEGEIIYNDDTDAYNYFDGVQWKNLVASGGGNSPGDIGGGAASMVLSFASGSTKHVETGATSYSSIAHFIYGGSNAIGTITNFNVNAWITNNGVVDVRLVDLNTGLTIVELLGINTQSEANVQSMGTITNLSTTPTVVEIQGRKVSGGGASKLRIASLEIQYA